MKSIVLALLVSTSTAIAQDAKFSDREITAWASNESEAEGRDQQGGGNGRQGLDLW
jgi:hypothetical protein